jgi:hypothetical protein
VDQVSLTEEVAWKLASFSGTFCLVEHAIQMLADNDFNEHELAAMKKSFGKDRQVKLTARLMDLAEQLREVQAHLDLVVHELEFGLHVKAPAD